MKELIKYKNGNATIQLFDNGKRIIEYEGKLKLDMCLNIDIRVSSKCSFGMNPSTGKAFCSFCHESATTDGKECDYDALKSHLVGLPKGIELAIGGNQITGGLMNFMWWCKDQGYVCNLTVNQGHILRDKDMIELLIKNKIMSGLGISFRPTISIYKMPKWILDYEHTVFHVISGIDSFQQVYDLKDHGVNKILILGEKDFGFNLGNVDLNTRNHKEWYWWVGKLFDRFKVVSFDNLALEQLNIKRFFNDDNWQVFNQGEYSFYINAIDGYFSPSSRNPERRSWGDITVKDYFSSLNK